MPAPRRPAPHRPAPRRTPPPPPPRRPPPAPKPPPPHNTNVATLSDPLGWLSEGRDIPRGHVRLACDHPAMSIIALLGPEPPKITGASGGWDVTARPRQVGMTTWTGVEPIQFALSLMFDGFSVGHTQDRALNLLLRVARGTDDSPPGILTVEGIPAPADEWVIESIDYGDAILTQAGNHYRQQITLTLREYVDPTYLQIRKGARQPGRAKTHIITVRRHDTPAKIAKRIKCKWTDLRKLNPTLVKRANQPLKAGTKLRAPVPQHRGRRAHGTHGSARGRSRS